MQTKKFISGVLSSCCCFFAHLLYLFGNNDQLEKSVKQLTVSKVVVMPLFEKLEFIKPFENQ